MNLTIEDLKKLQETLQEKQLDYQLELVDGNIVVMGLSDYISHEAGLTPTLYLVSLRNSCI